MEKYGKSRAGRKRNMRRIRFACWVTKATNIRSECVIIVAFPRQQWLRQRTSMLRYTYCPVVFCFRRDLFMS